MADLEDPIHQKNLEDSGTLLDPPRSRRCNYYWKIVRTILHAAVVTILFIVIIFSYIYIHLKLNINGEGARDRTHAVVSLIILLVAYTVLGFLFIFNSSGLMEKIISAGFLALVLSVFLFCSIGIDLVYRFRVEFLAGANIAAISAYCVWMLHPAVQAWLCTLEKKVRTILHVAVVIVLFFVIIFDYFYAAAIIYDDAVPLLIQLVAYTAVGCLYIFNSSNQMQKGISAGFLVLVLSVFLLSSIDNDVFARLSLVFGANIVAISLYSIWKLYLAARDWPWLPRWPRWLSAARDALLERSEPERQQETALANNAPFRIHELLREFSSDEIRAMTQDFATMVGQGGFAHVFRGSLDDGTAVAVKSLITREIILETGDADFLREVSIIANMHHRSLVRLLGYCLPRGGGGRYLVYPFFENGSLDRWLFHGGEERRRQLTWPARRCIAVDVARALAYLHHECHRRILHLDVKPGNILLDGSLRAHVSDFGISVSVARDLTSIVDTRGRGTLGYMAPEMLVNAVSDKSDVYSYGMTLLELVGGRRNFEPSSASDASSSATPDLARDFLPSIVLEKMARGELMEAVDAAMADVDEEAVELVVKVALCCIQRRRDMRPSMLAVVDMLEGRVDVDLPPESRPSSAAVDFPEPLSSSLTHGR
ncbi:unnamed protein product [Urochloa decumbens]|uniref:Protein kinase domain-containing protein n=1 Tax=Urochloa decumbens TaxID=240449 RepID=A0ABC8Z566_9POAL